MNQPLPLTEPPAVPLYDLSRADLEALLQEMGQPRYRAAQVWQWLYRHHAGDIAAMRTLPQALRQQLAARATLDVLKPAAIQNSGDGQTRKYLFQLRDGAYIETVLMRYDERRTVCISTQAGCAMGCVFCATGQMGLGRHLTAGEIVAQVMTAVRELAHHQERLTNVVMMGMGEPLHNYTAVMAALDCLTDAEGLNLGARRITLSTVGLVPAMRRYADEQRQSPLAVSLHAATDEERNRLIPINRKWPLAALMEACHYYIARTGRRVTFEWALIQGENDTLEQAAALGALVQGMVCHVNLIPLNPTRGYAGGPSSRERVDAFQAQLLAYGVTSSVRVRRGIDIQAGCGQLRERLTSERL